MKKSILDFNRMAQLGEKITWLTGYDYLTAKYEEKAGVDMILVGDSLGMVTLGYDTTYPVTMEDMIIHSKAVRRGAPDTFVVGDMPYMSYQASNEEAVRNAGRFTKEALCDAIKLEGGGPEICERIRAIASVGILTFGHIGLTPQFGAQMGGYRAQGKNAEAAKKLLDEALRIQDAGACAAGGGRTGGSGRADYEKAVDSGAGHRRGLAHPRAAAHLRRHGGHVRQLHAEVRQEIRRAGTGDGSGLPSLLRGGSRRTACTPIRSTTRSARRSRR